MHLGISTQLIEKILLVQVQAVRNHLGPVLLQVILASLVPEDVVLVFEAESLVVEELAKLGGRIIALVDEIRNKPSDSPGLVVVGKRQVGVRENDRVLDSGSHEGHIQELFEHRVIVSRVVAKQVVVDLDVDVGVD